MKRIILLGITIITCSTISAQLSVESSGKVNVQATGNQIPTMFAVGASSGTYSSYKFASTVHILPNTSYMTVGTYSKAFGNSSQTYGRSFGVYGVGGNATSGYNYGVVGTLEGTNYGAGILGSSVNYIGYIPGLYAGYFNGNTYVNGTLTATSVVTPSDIRLKSNITNISHTGQTLENLMKINVLSYNYKRHEIPEAERDTIQEATLRAFNEKCEADAKERHFGVSAQELQEVFPELVKEGQDGYLGVNYIELVPILIQAIQEMKAELEELRNPSENCSKRTAATSINEQMLSGNKLYQNTPNPFKEQTTISFCLADGVNDASICIFDMTGKTLKKLPISSGMESVSVGGYELGEGIFLYSLVVNGQVIDTKRMIISK